jgi:hypothetical protein
MSGGDATFFTAVAQYRKAMGDGDAAIVLALKA